MGGRGGGIRGGAGLPGREKRRRSRLAAGEDGEVGDCGVIRRAVRARAQRKSTEVMQRDRSGGDLAIREARRGSPRWIRFPARSRPEVRAGRSGKRRPVRRRVPRWTGEGRGRLLEGDDHAVEWQLRRDGSPRTPHQDLAFPVRRRWLRTSRTRRKQAKAKRLGERGVHKSRRDAAAACRAPLFPRPSGDRSIARRLAGLWSTRGSTVRGSRAAWKMGRRPFVGQRPCLGYTGIAPIAARCREDQRFARRERALSQTVSEV